MRRHAGEKTEPEEHVRSPEKRSKHTHGRVSGGTSLAVLQRSQFAHLFRKDGARCLFHSLNMRMVFGGKILEDVFRAFAHPTTATEVTDRYSRAHPGDVVRRVIADLSEKRLLVPTRDVDAQTYESHYQRALNQYRIQHLYILPTTACNLRCAYCFVEDEGRQQKPAFMDVETAEATVSSFAALTRESGQASVVFYGGEPLLNRPATIHALRRIRELEAQRRINCSTRVALLTNGVLVDDEVIRVFQETRPTIGVSIDGPRRLHNAARVDERGRGSFDAAIRGYKRLQEAGLEPGISCTLNALTIKHIDEIVSFIIDELKPRGMGFNLPIPRTGARDINAHFDHELGARQIIRAFLRLREAGIYEDRVMRRVRPFQSQMLHCKDCMGVGGQIVVTPTGRVGPCQAFLGVDDERYFPLDIRTLASKGEQVSAAADIYTNPLFGEWCQRFPLNMSECVDCDAISVCGGGCPYAAAVTRGSIWKVDDRICHQAKDILEWMIWDTYEHMLYPSEPQSNGD